MPLFSCQAAAPGKKVSPTEDPAKLSHWAFKAPVRPAVPEIANREAQPSETRQPGAKEGQIVNPVDAFIVARLEKGGLTISPEADPVTLCRRLYLDLIGLPPPPEEVDKFLAEGGGDAALEARRRALEALTNRLLASPHYGERWGRHWLDAARYADSDGYEKDKPRIAHFYRDWVIGAFNRDLPYDQFLIEQLAGDQLPDATQDQIVATGFLRNSLLNEEGGVDPEQFRMEAMFDRMDAIGKSVLGLTIQCAQCHDHKFDPITQADYYRLFAFLNNDHEAQPLVYSADEQMRRADVLRRIAEAEGALRHMAPDWEQRMAAWEDELKSHAEPQWQVITPEWEHNSSGGEKYELRNDGSYLAQGYQPTKHTLLMETKVDGANIGAFRIEVLRDPNLPCGGPGRSHLGTFGLTEFEVEAAAGSGKPDKVKFASAAADIGPAPETPVIAAFNEKTPVRRVIGPAEYAHDGKDDTAWSNDIGPGRRNRECEIVFFPDKPLEGVTALTMHLKMNHGGYNSDDLQGNNFGRFRLSIAPAADAALTKIPRPVRTALAVPRESRSPAQKAVIFSHWRTLVPQWKEQIAKVEALWKEHPEGATQFTLAARDEARRTSILKRGDWLKPDKPVDVGVPAVLHALPDGAQANRLTFARWVSDKKSPTTARAFVNRVWQAYFGTGLLAASEDLGTQSEPPSHPELLDWLAVEFMEHGWSLKHLHRLIVSSATYRQSSKVTPELMARDPNNRLLARGPRFRVEGEVVRDIQLAASGLLNPRIGGRSLMPPAPAFIFQPPASYAPFPWIEETGDNRFRRAVYTWRRRTTPYPFLQIFDTPNAESSCVRRLRSNTPLQALTTLNETLSMEAAQGLARRILESGATTDAERVAAGFRRVLSRRPTNDESRELLAMLDRQKPRIADGWLDARVLATGKSELPALPPNTTPAQLAAWTAVSRVLLNLDETFTKE
jgi:Protein of unknown function (DUF1553)/Protein of unknown function (DUF1549)